MEFRDTGLPADPMIYRAFTLYSKNKKTLPQKVQERDLDLHVAQLLAETTAGDNTLLSFALLQNLPPEAWGIVEQRFGKDVVALREELIRHIVIGDFSNISQASDNVKLYYLAFYIVALDALNNASGGKAVKPQAQAAAIFEDIRGTTSSPALEARFLEARQNASQDRQQIESPAETPANQPYHPFGATNLADTAQVRAAYEIVTTHANVKPDDVFFALRAAQILSYFPEVQTTAVVATLLNGALHDLTSEDLESWGDLIGQDAVKMFLTGGLSDPDNSGDLALGFKQMKLACTIATLEEVQEAVKMILDAAKEDERFSLTEMKQELMHMRSMVQMAQDGVVMILDRTGSPALEQLYKLTHRELTDLIARNMPDNPKPRPPFPPPYKPGF